MARVRSSVNWIGSLVVLALILSGWVLRTESASSGGTVSVDVSAQVKVTFSGLRYNRTTQTYDTIATLTNTSPDPIQAPLELHVVSITPATVTLQNPGGTASDGHSYVTVPLPTGELASAATVTNVVLRFNNPDKVQFTFTHHVFGVLAASNTPPVAHAGPDQSARVGETVTLDGSASTDAEGDPLTYDWTLPGVPASAAILTDATTVNPQLTLNQPGAYTAQLVVHDGQAESAPDTVTISTTNTAPVAHAGPNQTAPVNTTVQLDGSQSSDVDGNVLTFQWTLVRSPDGSSAELMNPTTVNPRLFLDRAGDYVVQLIVNDGTVDSAPASVTISTENSPPVAEAGPAQTVAVGATVQLNGAGSSDVDDDPLTYQWTLTSAPVGSIAELANDATVNPSFTADKAGTYVAQLIVYDGKVSSTPDTVTISTENSQPVAKAGPDQTAEVGETVTLDGSESSDADNDVLSYQWALTGKPANSGAALANPSQAQASFVPDLVGEYIAQLIVSDGVLTSDPDTAMVTVTEPLPTNRNPQITSSPVTTATVGQAYRYDVNATDPDAGDVLSYSLSTKPDGMTIDATTGLIQWTPTPDQAGDARVVVEVKDPGGLADAQDFTIAVAEVPPANQAPRVDAGANQTITLPTDSVALTGTVTDDGLPNPPGAVTITWTQDSGPGTVAFAHPASATTTATFSAAGDYVLRLTAADGALSVDDTVQVTVDPEPQVPLPPDPSTVAPPIDPTVATTHYAATNFLYSGSNPIQTGVAPGTIDPVRSAVIRGRVLDKQNQPLSGVTMTVLNHPEFGQTLSRADGEFDLAVNGGGYLTVNYQKAGYLSAQRQANVPWQDTVVLDDVVLIQYDPQISVIDLTQTGEMQVARGSVQTDESGTRQATLLFPPGTQAEMVMPDGSTQPITTLSVRATEFTVGPNGPQTMPAELPPNVAYTYAVDFNADEALVAGAKKVTFAQPVPFYVENFRGFPVGTGIPLGYYNEDRGVWEPYDNGVTLKILRIVAGMAELDTDGDGLADTGAAALAITDAERQRLATLYSAGQTLWRVLIPHFSKWDANQGTSCSDNTDAQPDEQECDYQKNDSPKKGPKPDKPCEKGGSIIECETQILGERLPLVGTDLTLNYRSDRVPGQAADRTLTIPLSGATVPSRLIGIVATVTVAGRSFLISEAVTMDGARVLPLPVPLPTNPLGNARSAFLPPGKNLSTTFTWDGKDRFGRFLYGAQPATVKIGYAYPVIYQSTSRFGYNGEGKISVAGGSSGGALILWSTYKTYFGTPSLSQAVGGWTPDVHHSYDPILKILYLGDGTRRSGQSPQYQSVITTLARENAIGGASGLTVAPDGGVLYSAGSQIRRVDPATGAITTFAGTGTSRDVAIAPDGSVLIADGNRILRVSPDGIITAIAGTGTAGSGGDGGPATQAQLSAPRSIAAAPDGSVYIAEGGSNHVRRIDPDGMISTFAGGGPYSVSGENVPVSQATFKSDIHSVAVGPDGSVYIDNAGCIRRVKPDGIITTFYGSLSTCNSGYPEGGKYNLAFAPDGSIVILGTEIAGYFRILKWSPDGQITTIAGTGACGFSGDGGPAARALLCATDIALAPDGSLYIADTNNSRIRKIAPPTPGFNSLDLTIASEDGSQLYRFSAEGRHISTVDTLTGAALYTFAYDGAGRLITITDADGNVLTIERDGSGTPTAIVAPFGQRTTLSVDGHGYLNQVTNPAGEAYRMSYTADGLLTHFTDPRNQTATLKYDLLGRLISDTDPAGGSQKLDRAKLPSGDGYTVTRTTGENRTTTYRVEDLSTGDQERRVTGPDGATATTLTQTNGTITTTAPDGTVTTAVEGPDPRFGMQAPITQSLTLTSGGKTATVTTAVTAALSNPSNPLSLTTLTTTATVNGRGSTSVYTAATRRTALTSAGGRQGYQIQDVQGRVIEAGVTGLDPVYFSYDARGRLSTVRQGTGAEERTMTLEYGADGYLARTTDALGRVVTLARDNAGRTVSQTLPDLSSVGFAYDAKGNLTALTPPGQPAHGFAYTPVDLTASYQPPTVPNDGPTDYAYNRDRQPTQVTRPDGGLITASYDPAGRLDTLSIPAGIYDYGYNAVSQLTSLSAPGNVALAYGYNQALLTGVTWSGALSGQVGYGYDNDFRLSQVTVNSANPIAYGYDADSLLTQAGALTLTRNAQNGLLTGTTLGVVSDSRGYNPFGEVTGYTATVNGQPQFAVQYTYDRGGRIVRQVETVGGIATTDDYGYDLRGRLTEVQRDNAVIAQYTYDANGNRLSRTGGGVTLTGAYDAQDRLLTYGAATYAYTAHGELQSKTVGGGVTTYDYDALGNLRGVALANGAQIDYLIDGQNRRVGKKVGGALVQGFLYQGQLKPIAELDGNGNIVSRFVYAGRANVPHYLIKNGQTYRIITDHLGSPRLVINTGTGVIEQTMEYDEFGRVLSDSNPGFQPFGFAGGLYDRDTGLVRFGARDYDPETGRWTVKDPIGLSGRDTNFYIYVQSDSVNSVDPLGLLIDYYSAELGGDVLGPVGVSVNVTIDRNGELYVGVGVDGSLGLPLAGSVTVGKVLQSSSPSPQQLRDFLEGGSLAVTCGYWLGGGVNSTTDRETVAAELGIVSPQLSGGYKHSWRLTRGGSSPRSDGFNQKNQGNWSANSSGEINRAGIDQWLGRYSYDP